MSRLALGLVVSGIAVALAGCGGSSAPGGGASQSAASTAAARHATAKAQDATAQVEARTAEVVAETLATDANGSYRNVTPAALARIEPALSATSGGGARLTAARGTATGYTLTTASATGDTFMITMHAGTLARTCTGSTTTSCSNGTW